MILSRVISAAQAIALLMPTITACGTAPAEPVALAGTPQADMPLGAALALGCSGCHSPAGGTITSLEGRTAENLREALLVYHQDTDGTTVMHRMVRGYSEADIDAISAYLGRSAAE